MGNQNGSITAFYEGRIRNLHPLEVPTWHWFEGNSAVLQFCKWFCWGKPNPGGHPPPKAIIAWNGKRNFCPKDHMGNRAASQRSNAMVLLWNVILAQANKLHRGLLEDRLASAAQAMDIVRGATIPLHTWISKPAFKEKYCDKARGTLRIQPQVDSYATRLGLSRPNETQAPAQPQISTRKSRPSRKKPRG